MSMTAGTCLFVATATLIAARPAGRPVLARSAVPMVWRAERMLRDALRGRPDSTTRFPRVEGTNLEGRLFDLPSGFEGELNVVIVAFQRVQQNDVDTWLPFLTSAAAARSDLRVYELPTLNRAYRFARSFIDGGMSRGIPSRATREATITLYIDKTPFKRALGIANEASIRVLLVSRDGRVLWQTNGVHDERSAARLTAAIDSATMANVLPK